MRKILVLFGILAFLALPARAAAEVKCPLHGYATCYKTGGYRVAPDGGSLYEWHCSCGDSWWVRE